MLIGAAAVIVAIAMSRTAHADFAAFYDTAGITTSAVIACLGVLLIFVGAHWWFERCAPWLAPIPARPTVGAFVLILSVCAVTYALFVAIALWDLVTVLELTAGFWLPLGMLALAVSAVLAYVAYGRNASAEAQRRLRPYFDFLLSLHPARNYARYGRVIFSFALAWGWWNLVVAPGMYGNQSALNYFVAAARNVFGKNAILVDGREISLDVDFQTYYAAPITSLEKRIERYVLFSPRQTYNDDAAGRHAVDYRSSLEIANDPRWVAIDKADQQRKLLIKIAFASGSPFPVFPAHRIHLPDIGPELLVDGGYAHNIPIEAAKKLGARRVLIQTC